MEEMAVNCDVAVKRLAPEVGFRRLRTSSLPLDLFQDAGSFNQDIRANRSVLSPDDCAICASIRPPNTVVHVTARDCLRNVLRVKPIESPVFSRNERAKSVI